MAKIVTDIPKRTGGGGATPKYDYDTMFDGLLRAYVAGEDFDTKPSFFAAGARKFAKAHGVEATIVVRENEVYVQAATEAAAESA